MKKVVLIAVATAMSIVNLSAQKDWYVTAGVQGNLSTINQHSYKAWTAAAGVGIHRMLGGQFSVGLNFVFAGEGNHAKVSDGNMTYSGGDHVNAVGGELSLAYFGEISDKFFYVPELALGLFHIVDKEFVSDVMNRSSFGAGISLLGLEFRPRESLGIRVNALSLAYNHNKDIDTFDISLNPSLTFCFRF